MQPIVFDYAVDGLTLETADGRKTIGRTLAARLGMESDTFKHIEQADLQNAKLPKLYQKATWFALGAQPLDMLFGEAISSDLHEEIWQHYAEFVRARGPWSAIKIGNQPYGILPVMNMRNALPVNNSMGDLEAYR